VLRRAKSAEPVEKVPNPKCPSWNQMRHSLWTSFINIVYWHRIDLPAKATMKNFFNRSCSLWIICTKGYWWIQLLSWWF